MKWVSSRILFEPSWSKKQETTAFHIFLVLELWQLRKSWNSCLAQLHLRGRGWTNFSPLFNDWDEGPPPTITSSYLESLGTSFCRNCYYIVKKYWAAWGFLFWKRSVSPSSPGVFLSCFGFVFGWACFAFVLEDTWLFAFTYSPTCGNS